MRRDLYPALFLRNREIAAKSLGDEDKATKTRAVRPRRRRRANSALRLDLRLSKYDRRSCHDGVLRTTEHGTGLIFFLLRSFTLTLLIVWARLLGHLACPGFKELDGPMIAEALSRWLLFFSIGAAHINNAVFHVIQALTSAAEAVLSTASFLCAPPAPTVTR